MTSFVKNMKPIYRLDINEAENKSVKLYKLILEF